MKSFVAALSALALLAAATPARAESSAGVRMAQKALRGFENVTLGFVTELPKTVYYDSVDHGIPYGLTVGALRGIGVGALRNRNRRL